MIKRKPIWLLEKDFTKGRDWESLPSIIQELGYELVELERDKVHGIDVPEDLGKHLQQSPCILYASQQFVRDLRLPLFPGPYGATNVTCMEYFSHIPRHFLVNGMGVFATWGDFKRNYKFWFKLYDTNSLFVRPNSGFKTFTGTTILESRFEEEVNSLSKLTSVTDETKILIGPTRSILAEFRFVIVDRKIVAYSPYSWDETVLRNEPMLETIGLVELACRTWVPDGCFVIDMAELPRGEVGIVEYNSFASAGLYKCDLYDVVKAVSAKAMDDYYDI